VGDLDELGTADEPSLPALEFAGMPLWRVRAMLPAKYGGLGIATACSSAPSAFLGGWAAAEVILRSRIPGWRALGHSREVHCVFALMQRRGLIHPKVLSPSYLLDYVGVQARLTQTAAWAVLVRVAADLLHCAWSSVRRKRDKRDEAGLERAVRFAEVVVAWVSRWTQSLGASSAEAVCAMPVSPRTRIPADPYIAFVRYRLGLSTVPSALHGTPCANAQCKGAVIDAYGRHICQCKRITQQGRHDRLRDA